MGRKPENTQALSGAERQVRYRERHVMASGALVRWCAGAGGGKPRPLTRPQCWHAAVRALVSLQAEYAAWHGAIPEATRENATGEALQTIVDLDLDELVAIHPPRGFGRDWTGRMTRFQSGRAEPGHAPAQNKNEADRSRAT
jgi:hypothetical protein